MSGLACIKCRVFLIPKKTGIVIEEGKPLTDSLDGPWGPYKLWRADLAECPKCGYQVAIGFGRNPMAVHYELDYEDKKVRYPPLVRIDACSGYKP
jgi:hypothetical protein